MSERFFCETPILGSTCQLEGNEAHHLSRVMRAAPGDEVRLFDGSGREFRAQISSLQGKTVQLDILETFSINRELPFALTLAVALPRGERQRTLVEKAVELGVTGVVPLQTQRSVAQPTDKALGRLRRTVIEASKQCGRNHLMQIAEAQTWEDFLQSAQNTQIYCADPLAEQPWPQFAPQQDASYAVAVGPEGGWTETELELAQASGAKRVSCGRRILRVETAVLAVASWFSLQAQANPASMLFSENRLQ